MTKRIPISLVLLSLLWCAASIAAKEADSEPTTLPSPAEFDPARYVGKWFEAARLPTAMQPDGSLASAEYALGEEAGSITVKNTAYDANGALLGSVEGKAILVAGEPKGRLRVGFGPEVPSEPNYCVLWVNPKYRFAVVGSPDRKSLWILARQVPVNEKRLKRFASIAKKAGYDTAKLVVATWPQDLKDDPGQGTPATPKLAGNWVLSIDGPDGEKVELPLILEMDGVKLTGKIGRGDDGWLPLKDSEVDGNSFAFSVERDRPGGGSMTYRLAGTIADDKLSGTAKTELNGEPVSRDWDAVRGKQEEEKNVAGIAGTWTLHLTGPDGQNVELPMELEVDGKTLKGRVGRGDGRWMKVENGEVDLDSFRFKVTRTRDDGGSMTYELTGKHTDGTLSGSANAKLGENEISVNWHAERKQ